MFLMHFVNIRSDTEMSKLSMNKQFKTISESFNGVSEKFVEINNKLENTEVELKQISGCSGIGNDDDTGECDKNENNEVTDDHGVNTGENNGGKITKNYEEIINEVTNEVLVIKMN